MYSIEFQSPHSWIQRQRSSRRGHRMLLLPRLLLVMLLLLVSTSTNTKRISNQQMLWNRDAISFVTSFVVPTTILSRSSHTPNNHVPVIVTQHTNRRQLYSSNDDDDDDSIDRDMTRIGWGKTYITPASSTSTNSLDYVLSESATVDDIISMKTENRITIGIALTREEGKNDNLAEAIASCSEMMKQNGYSIVFNIYQLPCIMHADGPDYETLQDILLQQSKTMPTASDSENAVTYDYVVITSPEAARVLASVWPWSDDSTTTSAPPKVAAVGKATEFALRSAGIDVAFVPTKATAETLVEELPPIHNDDTTTYVLYPASAKAADKIQTGLEERGLFSVSRFDTYDTVSAPWNATQQHIATTQCQIACFASPSAVKGWISNVEEIVALPTTPTMMDTNSDTSVNVVAACIGETSARACRNNGWEDANIFYPTNPGIDGWVEAIMEAAATVASGTTIVETIEMESTTAPTSMNELY